MYSIGGNLKLRKSFLRGILRLAGHITRDLGGLASFLSLNSHRKVITYRRRRCFCVHFAAISLQRVRCCTILAHYDSSHYGLEDNKRRMIIDDSAVIYTYSFCLNGTNSSLYR